MAENRREAIFLILVAIITGGVLAGQFAMMIGGKDGTASPQSTTNPSPAVQTITLTVHDSEKPWGFVKDGVSNPTIQVKLGSTVRIVLDDTGTAPHYWALDSTSPSPYNVSTEEVKPGEKGRLNLWRISLGPSSTIAQLLVTGCSECRAK